MITYDPKSWWGLIFKFHKSDTFRRLLPAMATVGVFSGGIAFVDRELWPEHLSSTTAVHSLLGFVISLLLVFRTNTAYERWWEGRKLWGSLVNTSRNLALKLNAYLRKGHPVRPALATQLGAYAATLKDHLRDANPPHKGPIRHAPNAVAAYLFAEIDGLYRRGDLTAEHVLMLNPDLSQLTEICGACERIKKTPIPYSYSLFIKKFVFAYIVSMPFVFVDSFGYWTALFTTFIFYVLGSLEIIAEEVENPFGTDANDLPTDDLAQTIAANVRDILVGNGAAPRA
ncbi:bestrophin family protein [Methylomagnum ishizawai]|uniref:bestrophin family protein n=1 Tax=Methylomagnum ishizawai TaxID=1760988 RepID=UPI001C32B998|nr:bestrophin family ion channel [Methylomagnum ishizawai]BBL75888.1 membrane protein [Methylomagnum ishizawai]